MGNDWDRASLEANTRPIRVERDLTYADLVVPRGRTLVALVFGCIGCGLGLAFLFVFWPLMLLSLLNIGVGRWIFPAVLTSGVGLAVVLYVWEVRVRRDAARELQ